MKCIADSAFYNCENIDSVEIPDSVTKIGGLKSVYVNEYTLGGVDKDKYTIFVPEGTLEKYSAQPAFEGFRIVEKK